MIVIGRPVSEYPLVRGLLATLLCLCLASCGYNTIPTLEEQAKAKWADVQNNYQRRADLIPWDPLESTCRHASLSIL